MPIILLTHIFKDINYEIKKKNRFISMGLLSKIAIEKIASSLVALWAFFEILFLQ